MEAVGKKGRSGGVYGDTSSPRLFLLCTLTPATPPVADQEGSEQEALEV